MLYISHNQMASVLSGATISFNERYVPLSEDANTFSKMRGTHDCTW